MKVGNFNVRLFAEHSSERGANLLLRRPANLNGVIKTPLTKDGRIECFKPISCRYDQNVIRRRSFH